LCSRACARNSRTHHWHRRRQSRLGRPRGDRYGAQYGHQHFDRSGDEHERRLHGAAASARPVQGERIAAGLQNVLTRGHRASYGRNRHRQRSARRRCGGGNDCGERTSLSDRIQRKHGRADHREQADYRAPVERPAGLHVDATHGRHHLYSDDVRRDRLLRDAGVGRQRIALGARQPHRQQRVPHRRGAKLRHWWRHRQLELCTAGRRDRGVQDRDISRRCLLRPNKRRRDQHDAPFRHQPASRIRHRPASWHVAGLKPDPEHPQQHLERGSQVLQRGRHGQRADQPQQDVLHGWLPGLLREHPVPDDEDRAERGAAARGLLANHNGQRHTDPHLRPGHDDVHGKPQLVHTTAVPGEHHSGEPVAPDCQDAAPLHSATKCDAEQPRRLEQLRQLAEHRPLSLQLVPSESRSHLQREPSAVGQ